MILYKISKKNETNNDNVDNNVDNNVGVEYIEPFFHTTSRHIYLNSMDENEHFEMNYGDELSCKITHYGIESITYCSKSCKFWCVIWPNKSTKKLILK